ncbi:MAG: RidA family protein [Candidatus Dormibacteria bacterium]
MRDSSDGPTGGPLERLKQLGLELPVAPRPLASYVPARAVPAGGDQGLLFVSGQIAMRDGAPAHVGSVPDEVSIEEAEADARMCALNILAQVHQAVGLENLVHVAQVTGFVRSRDGFGGQPGIINAASDLLFQVLGEAGRHARVAVGTNALPLNACVEIAAVVLVRNP